VFSDLLVASFILTDFNNMMLDMVGIDYWQVKPGPEAGEPAQSEDELLGLLAGTEKSFDILDGVFCQQCPDFRTPRERGWALT